MAGQRHGEAAETAGTEARSGESTGGPGDRDGQFFVPAAGRYRGWFVGVLVALVLVGGVLPGAFGAYYANVHNHLQFVVHDDGLEVSFRFGRITVAAGDIEAVTLVPSPPSMARQMGAGLPKLQMGWYRLADYGRVYRLTTGSRSDGPYVYVDTAADAGPATSRADTRYVFNPRNAEAFVKALEAIRSGGGVQAVRPDAAVAAADMDGAAGVESDGSVVFEAVREAPMGWWGFGLLTLVIVLPLGVGMPFIIARGRRDMGYHVGPEGIKVLHLGEKLYSWDAIEDVTVREEPLRGLFRVFGTSMPGYYAGTFRATGMPHIQMNATRREPPLVVVTYERTHLVITPEDIPGFMDAVDRWRGEG